MPPLSANANLCRLFIRPSGEWSRAGTVYHSLITRRIEFGVAESRFDRFFPMAWVTRELPGAYAPAFSPVVKRLLQVLHKNFMEWWPYTEAVLVQSLPKLPAA